MLNYLGLIRKKKELIYRLEQKSFQLNEELLELEQEKKNIDQEIVSEYIKLNQLQKLEEEMNLSNLIMALLIIFFFLSVIAYPILVSFGLSSLVSFLVVAGVNAVDAVVCFLLSKVMGRKFRKEKRENQGQIEDVLSVISDLNLKKDGANQQYHFVKSDIRELQTLLKQEEKDIRDISRVVIECLLEKKNCSMNLLLDQMIEKSISQERQVELDLNVKRVLSYLENK